MPPLAASKNLSPQQPSSKQNPYSTIPMSCSMLELLQPGSQCPGSVSHDGWLVLLLALQLPLS
eukprot:10754064-Prorocentrum_lima.AAC.1